MKAIQNDKISNEISVKQKNNKNKKNKKQKKKSSFFSYLYLFSIVFLGALWFLSYVIKSYSPEIDVTIGNHDSFTLSDADTDVEIKTIDERLKWIQMEDDLPSVSVLSAEKSEKNKRADKIEKEETKINTPPIPKISEIKKQQLGFKDIPTKEVVTERKPVVTKVYLGNFATMEDAVDAQNKIKAVDSSIAPFIKSVKGHYIVQLGSFSDSERAGVLVQQIRQKGYYPKITYEN